MDDNYGLRAFKMYEELLKRVDKLENELNEKSVYAFVFDDYTKILDASVAKNYIFKSKGANSVRVRMTVKNLTGKFKIVVYLNGVKKNETEFSSDTDEYFDEFTFKKGKNSLRVEFVRTGEEYCFFTPTLRAEGAVELVNEPKRISVTESAGSFGNNYRFCFISGDILEYRTFSGEGGDNLSFTIDGVKSAATVTAGNAEYIFYLTLSGRLKCVKPSGSAYPELDIPEVYGADVAGYAADGGAKIFVVKFGEVFVADFTGDGALNLIKSGIKARRIYAENNIKCIIAASDGKPSNLIKADRFPVNGENYTSVTLPAGDNYHLYLVDGGYDVVFSENGVIKKITIKNGVASGAEALTAGDEIIKTDSGALKRSGQNLKEEINYKYKL